jgi:hypothetical protein
MISASAHPMTLLQELQAKILERNGCRRVSGSDVTRMSDSLRSQTEYDPHPVGDGESWIVGRQSAGTSGNLSRRVQSVISR